jgi:ferredoxin
MTPPSQPIRADLRAVAADLLGGRKVDVLIGYEAGSQPLVAAPLIIEAVDPDALHKVESLIFDARCEMNLANYLHKHKGRRVALVVKGCDCRSVVGLLQEKQVEREKLVILGAPCAGVVDVRLVARAVGGVAITSADLRDNALTVHSGACPIHVSLDEVIYAGCRDCPARNPVLADFLVADPVPQPDLPEISPEVTAIRALPSDRRYERFASEMGKCILCYACRNLCPACYCRRCFADDAKPRLVGRTDDPADAMLFHLGRLLHLGGRCTGCGACVRGCPMNVDLRLYNDQGRQHVRENYGFVAGLDPSAEPPLGCYGVNDENGFIL